jgi:hypothetical protein
VTGESFAIGEMRLTASNLIAQNTEPRLIFRKMRAIAIQQLLDRSYINLRLVAD